MRIGLDFGTTNSGAAIFDGRQVRLFPIDRAGLPPTVIRSMLYITRDHDVYIGREALDAFYEQNSGRARKIVRRRVGDLEQVFSEGLRVVETVYAREDELSPGRLVRSLKSELGGDYVGTSIFGRHYELEALIALYLHEIRQRVETETGQSVDGVVLGRPVNFVGCKDEEANRRAENRLRRAAEKAGFGEVTFELEPVAAALHYEHSLAKAQNIVVFDFGGGTLDITAMRVGDPSERKIFATGGVGIAGELFDRRIVAQLILDHLGKGTNWGDEKIPFPRRYPDAILNIQSMLEMHDPETLQFFRRVQLSSDQPARIRALESMIRNDNAVRLYEEVERVKIELSKAFFETIRLKDEEIDIWQPLTRSQFETIIGKEIEIINSCLMDTLERSGLNKDEIDAVVRTGGSAQIPAFIRMLEHIFGENRVILSDVFGGVTAGLAIRAAMPTSF